MAPMRVIMLCVALTAAIGAGVIVRGMAKGQAKPEPAAAAAAPVVQEPMTEVLIAKRDLPAGTTLVQDDMGWQAWPQASLNAEFITKTSTAKKDESPVVKLASETGVKVKEAVAGPGGPVAELTGTVVREPILAGEPMSRRKLVRAGSAGIMSITLQPGMRGIAIPLSAESAAGGFILPGDHVDVVQSRETEAPGTAGGKRFLSETVLKNVKVLAIDQATGAKDAAVVGATATLELSPNQAEVLVLARSQGQLTLILRSYADTDGPTETAKVEDLSDPDFKAGVVRVFRNGQSTEVTVTR